MELWNDFEGKAVDGRFQLDHLIGPKGRSAYFTTKDETGAPAVIRLIESLNDEEEILARWRAVTRLQQEHLVEVLDCGQTVLDGTHLVYAVMEPTDAELADVLRERALTPDETRQVALGVADGLEFLHAKGLVHQHVDAENVLAKGETVKLRSDLVRETPEGAEGTALRAKDVRDLSLLLSHALTRSRRFGEARLPVPFEEIVRKGESGAWGLSSIVAALRPATPIARPAAPATPPVRPAQPTGLDGTAGAKPASSAGPAVLTAAPARSTGPAAAPSSTPIYPAQVAAAPVSTAPAAVASRLADQTSGQGDGFAAHLRAPRVPGRIVMEPELAPKKRGLLIAVGAGLLLLLLLGIYLLRSKSTDRAVQTPRVVQSSPTAAMTPQRSAGSHPASDERTGTPAPQRMEKPSAAVGSARLPLPSKTHAVIDAGSPGQLTQWRVVAFTYNHEEQATQKVHALAAAHPALKPEVFSSTGRAPYLVTLGGWMSTEQATVLRNKARSEGLPRDIYTQNYRAQSH